MSKLSFDLINMILSFRPPHPTAILIKQLEKDLIKQLENRNKYIRDKIEYNFHNQCFFYISNYRNERLQKYKSDMFCYCRINDINKVNKYLKRFFNKKYYYDEKADIIYYNQKEREAELRWLNGEMTQKDQEEFDRELSVKYYKDQVSYYYFDDVLGSDEE